MMPPSITKYGSPVRLDAQIVALCARRRPQSSALQSEKKQMYATLTFCAFTRPAPCIKIFPRAALACSETLLNVCCSKWFTRRTATMQSSCYAPKVIGVCPPSPLVQRLSGAGKHGQTGCPSLDALMLVHTAHAWHGCMQHARHSWHVTSIQFHTHPAQFATTRFPKQGQIQSVMGFVVHRCSAGGTFSE